MLKYSPCGPSFFQMPKFTIWPLTHRVPFKSGSVSFCLYLLCVIRPFSSWGINFVYSFASLIMGSLIWGKNAPMLWGALCRKLLNRVLQTCEGIDSLLGGYELCLGYSVHTLNCVSVPRLPSFSLF